MKKTHLVIVVLTTLVVAVAAMTAGSGVLESGDTDTSIENNTESQPIDPDSMTVESVSVRNRTANGVVTLDIGVAGDLDRTRLGQSLAELYDDPTTNVSSIELLDIERNVVTVAVATDGRSSPTHVAAQVTRHLDGISRNENQDGNATRRTSDASADSAGAVSKSDSDGESTQQQCEPETVFYQLDFVAGEPIENLRGPEGTYTPDDLIRFAHGSTAEPLVRSSDGEFTSNESLRSTVESRAIAVENGTATITFSIKEGAEPVELTLASYEKPGRFWSPETESEQEFIDADTGTFGPGGPYTLHVALPEAESAPCETGPEEPTTATDATSDDAAATSADTAMPDGAATGTIDASGTTMAPIRDTPTEAADTGAATNVSPASSPPTCPAPIPATTSGIDLKLRHPGDRSDTDDTLRITVDNLAPGETRTERIAIVNTGTATGHRLDIDIENIESKEGVNLESETDTETNNGGELDDQLRVRAVYENGREYAVIGDRRVPTDAFVDFGTIETAGRSHAGGVGLSDGVSLAPGDHGTLTIQYRFPHLPTNNEAQGDVVTFDIVVTLSQNDVSACPT